MSKTIVAIKNPNEDAIVVDDGYSLTADEAAGQYGPKIKLGAFVTLIDVDWEGSANGEVESYVADRSEDRVYLQSNDSLASVGDIDRIGPVVTYVDGVPLEREEPPVELETFTVFGINDDSEKFVAVVSATPETVREVGISAGLVDADCEHLVQIVLVARGDQSAVETV